MSSKKILERKILKNLKSGSYKQPIKKRSYILFNTFKVFIVIFILAMIITAIFTSALLAQYSKNLPPPSTPFTRKLPESTQIYSSDGTLLYTLYSKENRVYVPLNKIPSNMKWSMLAAEDINFYQEDYGIDVPAILRAAAYDVLSPGYGNLQGASTITQQLVKYTTLGDERTIGRKVQELILTLKIEQQYSKNQVLESYLNTVSFGGSNYGVEAAARSYFGKDIWNLDLAQCAMLAGLPQAPGVYSPLFGTSPNLAKQRQMYVLNELMKYRNKAGIKKEDIINAENETLTYTDPNTDQIISPHFVFFIKNLLEREYGAQVAQEGGLKVYTSLNMNYQNIAQKAVTDGVNANLKSGQNAHNASLITIDNKTGDILAMVGSEDYSNQSKQVDGNINMTTSLISPGSSIKPFVYILGFEKGDKPDTKIMDGPVSFGTYAPTDWDNKWEGLITISKAILDSRNAPAVLELNKIGVNPFYDFLKKLDFQDLGSRYNYGLSMAIGGEDVTLLDLTHGYTIFPNNGKEVNLRPILKVYDKYGNLIQNNNPSFNPDVSIDNKYTSLMNSILVNYHTLAPVKKAEYDVAGKTGTSQYNKNLLFMGYSQDITTGVWAGNTDQSLTTNNSWGETAASPIWNNFMLQVLPLYPKDDKLKVN